MSSMGYDTGFYLATLKAIGKFPNILPPHITDRGLLEATVPFFKLLNLISLNSEIMLFSSMIVINIILAGILYLYCKEEYSKKSALIALILYSLSIIQYEIYWHFLFRTMLALLFLLVSFWLIKKKTLLFLIPAVFIILIHKSTPFIFFLTIIIYLIVKKEKKSLLITSLIIIVGMLYAINMVGVKISLDVIRNNFLNDTHMIREGNFINISEYILFSWWYLIFAIWQVYQQIKTRKINLPLLLFIVSGILIVFKFIFYRRLSIYLDLAAIILAGQAIGHLLELHFNKHKTKAITVILVILSLITFQHIYHKASLIDKEEFETIKNIQNLTEPETYLINLNPQYSPWLEGWSERWAVSPGILRDRWQLQDWEIIWENNDLNYQMKLFNEYDKPLYLYVGSLVNFSPNEKCFEKINNYLFEYVCD